MVTLFSQFVINIKCGRCVMSLSLASFVFVINNFVCFPYFPNVQLENFVADIGGQLGLWLGVSVLTGAELVELVILIILHFFPSSGSHQKRKKNEVAMEEGNFT